MNPLHRSTSPGEPLARIFCAAILTTLLSLAPAAPPAQAAPTTIASQGTGAGGVERPVGTAVDQSNGDLYVADSNNLRIDKFDANGDFLLAWGFGVADNTSQVLQTCGPLASPPTIKCFSPKLFGSSGPGSILPEGLAVDQASHDVYVADRSKHRVTRFSSGGELVYMVGPDVALSGLGNTGADESQSITVKATSGSFTLSLTAPVVAGASPDTETTTPIPYDAPATEVQSALESLTSVESGDLFVSGGPGDPTGSSPYTVSFTGGKLQGNDVPQLTAGGSQLVTVQGASGGTFALSFKGGTTSAIPYDAPAITVQEALAALPAIGSGNVSVTGSAGGPWTVSFTAALAGEPQPLIGASKSGLTPASATVDVGQTASIATLLSGGGPEVCQPSRGDLCKVASSSGVLSAPASLAVNASGNLWVGDSGRVVAFDSEGRFLAEAAVPGGGGQVKGLAFDPLGSGDLWMKSQSLPGVRRYAVSGSPPLQTLTEVGSPLDLAGEPEALVLDSAGNLYVGDKTRPYRFKAYDPSGELFSQFGAGQVIGHPGAGGGGAPGGTPLSLDETAGFLYAASSASGSESAVQRFDIPQPGPLPEEARATDLLPTSATLSATLNPEGHATTYRFQYLTRAAYEEQGGFEGPATMETGEAPLPGSGFEAEEVNAAIDHLLPGTEYRFRLLAANEKGQNDAQGSFATPAAVGIDAQWTDQVAAASAVFEAELDPRGAPAEWRLEYGTTEAYGSATAFQPIASSGPVRVATRIAGLSPDTLYHYRFVAKDERAGVPYLVEGGDRTVLTALGVSGFELPDERAWEQVTPLHKGGGRIVAPWLGSAPASEDGSALAFISVGPVSEAGGDRFPEPAQSLARRGAGGWSAESIEPPHETAQPIDTSSEYRLFSPDLAFAALEPRGLRVKQPGPLSEEASEWSPYLRENLVDPVRWRPLLTGKAPFANVCPETEFGGKEAEEQLTRLHPPIHVQGGSPDLQHLILKSNVALGVPPACEGLQGGLYEWAGGKLTLVSRLPDGTAVVGVLGSGGTLNGSVRGAVSGDGRFVYWENAESNPTALYLRDTALGQTVRLDDPQPQSFGGLDRPVFQGASLDGRHVFFTDTRHLTPDAGEAGADLYECEIVESAGQDECALQDVTPETEARESADVLGMVSAIDEAGDDLYFVANGALAPGAVSGDCAPPAIAPQRCNLYHAHRDGGGAWSTRLIAVLSGADWPDWAGGAGASTAELVAAGSPSGRYLAFMSQLPLTGYDNRDARGGQPNEEVFRYDSVAGSLVCVSCAPSGSRPRGVIGADGYQLPSDWRGLWTTGRVAATLPDPENAEQGLPASHRPRAMLDNGRVLFNAFDSLVPADSNGTADAYVYEPWGLGSCSPASKSPALAQAQGGGCVALLSSGTSERESAVIDSSASGDDVFIITASPLSVLDEDPDYDIYDARVHGVPAVREETPECFGEACQGAYVAPDDPTPASEGFRGAGNLRPPKARGRKCPRGKRKVHRAGRTRCIRRRLRHKHNRHRHRRSSHQDRRARR